MTTLEAFEKVLSMAKEYKKQEEFWMKILRPTTKEKEYNRKTQKAINIVEDFVVNNFDKIKDIDIKPIMEEKK